MKHPSKVLAVFPSLPRVAEYPLQEFKVRVVKYENSPPLLDIREFVTSTNFQGYSPKGISITKSQLEHIIEYAHDILKGMEENVNEVQPESEVTKDPC